MAEWNSQQEHEEEISRRAKSRRFQRQIEGVGKSGYTAEEETTAKHILMRLLFWYGSDVPTMKFADGLIEEWRHEVEEAYKRGEGKDPRTYKYFHALSGSTPPAETVFEAEPDLPGESAVLLLVEKIDAALRERAATQGLEARPLQ